MTIDVALARSLTPACGHVHHLNNAGASPSPRPVLDAVVSHLRREAEVGGYEAAAEASGRIDATYASVARLVGGEPVEVALVDSATSAWRAVFHSMRFAAGDRIVTGRCEYASNAISLLQAADRSGVEVVVVDDDPRGGIDLDRLEVELRRGAALVSLTHVPTNGGLVNPAEEVGRLARVHGVPYLLDACQSAGQVDLDVTRIGCDALTATGRKFLRGPRGTGFAWVRRGAMTGPDPIFAEPSMLDLHSAEWTGEREYRVRDDARRFETWESSVACRLGLGAAVDHALGWGMSAIEARVTAMAAALRDGLSSIGGVHVHDVGERQGAIVTFTVDGHESADVCALLRQERVNTSVSPVNYAQWDLPSRGLGDLVRASVHYFNDEADLDALCAGLLQLAR